MIPPNPSASALSIDKQTGALRLPTGDDIGSDLTQDAFRASALGQRARSADYGTLPWIHYYFAGGRVCDRDLQVSLCFYDQMLVYATVQADLHAAGPNDWANFSLDTESATAEFHLELLTSLLGAATRVTVIPGSGRAELERMHEWIYEWGRVTAGHSSRDGNTSFGFQYADRFEEARRRYDALPRHPAK
jgi:hypothetical protein